MTYAEFGGDQTFLWIRRPRPDSNSYWNDYFYLVLRVLRQLSLPITSKFPGTFHPRIFDYPSTLRKHITYITVKVSKFDCQSRVFFWFTQQSQYRMRGPIMNIFSRYPGMVQRDPQDQVVYQMQCWGLSLPPFPGVNRIRIEGSSHSDQFHAC